MKKNFLKTATILTLVMFITGCANSSAKPSSTTTEAKALGTKTVYIRSDKASYSANSRIAQNIKDECKIDRTLIKYIQEVATQNGMRVVVKNDLSPDDVELKVEITDAISAGNAFIGHRKFVAIAGGLTKGGQSLGTFEAARRTGGGMFAGFKGSCAVLGRAVKALAQDTVKWMKNPKDKAMLGDVRLIPKH
ncbi:MAG: hypothetical protein GXO60_07505 [Epsilonproteobacteria bacterium]|nr:hypothetical protein [Campylobacterota bacterium]